MIHVGCAGWSLPRQYAEAFPQQGSHLQRYAARLGAVEINSSFYRPHLPATYARWACAVPADFRFAVKLPKHITHELQLERFEAALDTFLGQCQHLGDRLGCLLVQLPPSLAHDDGRDRRFFERLRQRHAGPVAVEPRHASWQAAQSTCISLKWRRALRVLAPTHNPRAGQAWSTGACTANRASTAASIPNNTCNSWLHGCGAATLPVRLHGASSTTRLRVLRLEMRWRSKGV